VIVVVRFFSASESREVSCLIRTSQRQTRVPTEQLPKHHLVLPEVTPLLSRGHSSFRRLNCPETTPRSESFAILRSILFLPGKMNTTTDFLDHRLHSRRLLHCHIISHFKCATTLIPTQTVTEGIIPAIMNKIQTVMKKSQYANFAIMKIYMTHTSNNYSQGIYTLRVDIEEKLSKPL